MPGHVDCVLTEFRDEGIRRFDPDWGDESFDRASSREADRGYIERCGEDQT